MVKSTLSCATSHMIDLSINFLCLRGFHNVKIKTDVVYLSYIYSDTGMLFEASLSSVCFIPVSVPEPASIPDKIRIPYLP